MPAIHPYIEIAPDLPNFHLCAFFRNVHIPSLFHRYLQKALNRLVLRFLDELTCIYLVTHFIAL